MIPIDYQLNQSGIFFSQLKFTKTGKLIVNYFEFSKSF